MNKTQIISQIANEKLVERVINKIDPKILPSCPDLANDIYLSLMEKDSDAIVKLYESGQLAFFIIRMVKNNIFSSNSPYYRIYKKYENNAIALDEHFNSIED